MACSANRISVSPTHTIDINALLNLFVNDVFLALFSGGHYDMRYYSRIRGKDKDIELDVSRKRKCNAIISSCGLN